MTIARESRRNGFTLVELLTVMGIIVILISLLLPALGTVNRYAKKVKQRAQFHAFDVALELYKNEFDEYPDSGLQDATGQPYCGAMKFCEALLGQDLLGFHPNSYFLNSGQDNFGTPLYDLLTTDPDYVDNLKTRKGPYLELENANAYKLKHLYGAGNTGTFEQERYVLCDVYSRVRLLPDADNIRGKSGMPILYYKADTSKISHSRAAADLNPDPRISQSIYNYNDNDELVQLGLPWDATGLLEHPMDSRSTANQTSTGGTSDTQKYFYEKIRDEKFPDIAPRPKKADSYILISAGFDGEYGTPDDIFNFGG